MKPQFTILLLLFSLACEHTVTPPEVDPGFLISTENAANLDILLVDYDSVKITHSSGANLRSREFQGVGLGIIGSSGYQELYFSGSTYDAELDIFSFTLDFPFRLDYTQAETPIAVRYLNRSSGFTQIDTVVYQYKYPYSNTELFLSNTIMISPAHFQDIARIGQKFYFHPIGPEGLYEHDLTTGLTRTLVQYGAGDHIAADSIYVFCDINHNSIHRYNLLNDSLDLIIAEFGSYDIRGLETYNGYLYCKQGNYLRKYTYDGVPVDSTIVSTFTYHLSIYNGVLYGGSTLEIKRIDLSTMTSLPSLLPPSPNMEGFKIYGGVFYFCDFGKSIVCTLPLQDLQ